jgi:hypothetical protein
MARRKHRARPSARRLRAQEMARGAVHPYDRPELAFLSRKCAAGRHSECAECGCECHAQDISPGEAP